MESRGEGVEGKKGEVTRSEKKQVSQGREQERAGRQVHQVWGVNQCITLTGEERSGVNQHCCSRSPNTAGSEEHDYFKTDQIVG